MSEKIKLADSDRQFFSLVSEAAFSNPFSAECIKIVRKYAGAKNNEVGDALAKLAIPKVLKRVDKIEERGNANFKLYADNDKEIVRIALLYDAYHRFQKEFDKLILNQIKAGDAPCPVPFAKEALLLLKKRGFLAEEARHYFAFFYQLRRTFYFVYNSLVGQSRSMEALRSHLWNNIFTYDPRWYEKFLWNRMEDFSTFLVGETGTGKGTAAAAIGQSGFIPFDEKKRCFTESFTSNFIEINLSQFPESLIESELFGHTKGAFTGAVNSHQGVFACCKQYGSIFLDEIGDVSIPVQIKLLKVLQERNFSTVGSHKKLRFQGRIIAATNKPLEDLRREGAFRDDFYYRLCSDVIMVPSLRQQITEEPQTLDILLGHTIQRITGEPTPELQKTIRKIIDKELGPNYAWPGNVRELEQAVRRILLTHHYKGDFREEPFSEKDRLLKRIGDESIDANELLASYCAILYQKHGTYEEVARITRLDRRTVKKYIQIKEEA